MKRVTLAAEDDFEGWRDAARSLIAQRVPAADVTWQVGAASGDLFGGEAVQATASPPLRVPRAFIELAQNAILHSDPERFALLYQMLFDLVAHRRGMDDAADPLLRRIETLARQVRRDIHKMRAFVRFREVQDEDGPRFVAWFEPEHHIVRANARFFIDRFAAMRWSILTPELSLHWDGETLREGPGATRADAPDGDPAEAVWKTYYAAIFNPARLKTGAMLKEMPRRYWKNMPETALVPGLIAGARQRETNMVQTARAQPRANSAVAWEKLRDEARHCTRCDLYRDATQTVFGEGPLDAELMFVGEQPGDQEDLAGKPFVGPAGAVFDRALAEAGVDRSGVYVTNAVKHFKFERRGKRRIHSKPDAGEIQACRWWLDQELLMLRPRVVVALGATAARAVTGKVVTISRERSRPIPLADGATGWITIHPSFLLRLPDKAVADQEYGRFVDDLRAVRDLVAAP